MPSDTQKTWARRTNKARRMGKTRKRLMRKGSTPAFPIHVEQPKQD
jgi:hypothetical protein